ncbi:ferrous iron transporter B [Sphingorhabdus soli]|uniref:Ferrous iron transport protein B n=1 Tax=Flavisphingopyxis soli TaxID=2601267 RepID=A0A5C6ULH5_9SPHN|nr:ferrous iron transporter B [Sphingorhabdus soli]TXC73334.1 ferrous iron transporter B [Sphingorhabdus soli]
MTVATPMVALVGNPNSGKSSLFNALTGARQKIGNYPGVTVERKSGRAVLSDGRPLEMVDLPGSYSLTPASPDEEVTRAVVTGHQQGERRLDAMIVVLDASNLDQHLPFALELIAVGTPVVVALNMIDMATRDGLELDAARLSADLGVPVIPTVAVRGRGLIELIAALEAVLDGARHRIVEPPEHGPEADRKLRKQAAIIARAATVGEPPERRWTQRIDAVLMHPILGFAILLAILFVMFQAVFAWSATPADAIDVGIGTLGQYLGNAMPDNWLRSMIVDGVIAGVGAVVVFLPQILVLFLFILVLEATGYLTRAAFLMDGIMAKVGLSGRGFIPLLSSFACAIPGIMATRAISDPKDRLTTILIAPLMTCSARLPVYAIIIAAFIPARSVGPGIGLQGLVLFILYLTGIVGALAAAYVLRRTVTKGASAGLIMEMPRYQWPRLQDVALGLWQRAWIFLKRAGTIIFFSTMLLWALLSFPKPPAGSDVSPVRYSLAGRIADNLVAPIVEPIGFNKDIALALIPAMAAREVAVSALGTVYAINAGDDDEQAARALGPKLAADWSLATALAFLAWFVFAPQCISTIAVTRRETNSWRWPALMVGYLFTLAYVFAGATYWIATALGLS